MSIQKSFQWDQPATEDGVGRERVLIPKLTAVTADGYFSVKIKQANRTPLSKDFWTGICLHQLEFFWSFSCIKSYVSSLHGLHLKT